ncbi:MAG: hypothetical protein K9H64_11255 [Bacteroidales bacterium]|nr:hypothetical protein [Bacteroidales bacterium]MCF8456528.1 hypothetical protein [Bacteroidales bacterium]
MLPKFLFADNSQESPDTIYVVHTQSPRCIFECPLEEDFYDSHIKHWIDPEPKDEMEVQILVNQADEFLDAELENQEDLYDEDEE